jgi:catechol 2,3-dioxygenase-like lactoylglutathione lyase family enzyme
MQPLLRNKPRLERAAIFLVTFYVLRPFAALAAPAQDQPQRPGIDHVTVYVSDVNKSQRFYSDVLGLAVGCTDYAGPDTCLVVPQSGQRVFLRPAPVGAGTPKNWLAEVAFATDDVGQMRSFLAAHKLSPGTIRKHSDSAQSFQVRDPEGNEIAFVQRPSTKAGVSMASGHLTTHLIHAGWVVKDMATENRFYVDILGFRLYWYGGFKDDGTDWYELQVPDGPDWIEYMLNISANADHKELGIQNHFSFGVKDVHVTATQLRSNGLQTFDGPEVGRDGKDSLDAYDPDDTRVEIMEFTPVQKPCCHPYTADHPKP